MRQTVAESASSRDRHSGDVCGGSSIGLELRRQRAAARNSISGGGEIQLLCSAICLAVSKCVVVCELKAERFDECNQFVKKNDSRSYNRRQPQALLVR